METIGDLNPIVGIQRGVWPGSDELPDFSATLAELDAVTAAPDVVAAARMEGRAARLLRERLAASLAMRDSGKELRAADNLFTPVHSVRSVFVMMPSETADDWAVIASRLQPTRAFST